MLFGFCAVVEGGAIMGGSAVIPLVSVNAGEPVRVVDIIAGHGLASRLEALGIRPGTNIIKRSEMFMRGPVTVEAHGTQIAIGYGMASKILVERIRNLPSKSPNGNKDA
jgi:ferrous iron transport protein A